MRLIFLVAGVGLEPTTSRLWAWRAANCSTPRRFLTAPQDVAPQNTMLLDFVSISHIFPI